MDENKGKIIQWYPGHMAKTKKQIAEIISMVDVVIEVIDARIPYSSRIPDLKKLTRDKQNIIVFNKYDLCDKDETGKWIDKYKNEGNICVTSDSKKSNDYKKVINEVKNLMTELNKKRANKGLLPKKAKCLVVGVPNVGKSTLINRLVGRKAAVIGDKPGVTKALSWIRINKDIELLDSPGILWPKIENQQHAYNLASLSSIKEEILDPYELSVHILKTMYKLYPEHLKNRYGIEKIDFDDIVPTLDQIAIKRGALLKGGEKDYDKVYSIIIRDLKDNLLGKITFDRIEELQN